MVYHMNDIYSNKTHFILYTLKWMSIYVGIGLVASLLLPFPISLVVAFAGFMLINFLRTRLMMKRIGISAKGFFNSLSPSSNPSAYDYSPIKYYCMSCGNEHKEMSCPVCGSKMKRVG